MLRYARTALVLAVAALLTIGSFAPLAGADTPHVTAGPWTLIGWRSIPASHADQGLATVSVPGGGERSVLRGNSDVPASLRAQGWWHIGDPGSGRGYLLDAFQGLPSMHAKLFVLTAPDGRRTERLHRLAPGEMINNSFAAVAPSARWFVTGEWRTVSRFLVFPMPHFNPAARRGRDLPLATTIRLTAPARNVQGCAFASATELVCSTNDPSDDLFGVARQLLEITLPHPVDGRPETATPVLLGGIPQVSGCGVAETEGIDVSGNQLRIVAHEPSLCSGRVDLFTYHLRGAGQHGVPGDLGS